MASATGDGSGAPMICARSAADTRAIDSISEAASASTDARSAPPRSMAVIAAVNAPAVTTKPGGTGRPALTSSPSEAPLPPTSAAAPASASGSTSGELMLCLPLAPGRARSSQHPDGAAVAVHPHPVAGPDPLGGVTAPDDGGHPVLARDDRRVRHRAADVGDRGLDLREHRGPGRRGDRDDEDLPFAQRGDLRHVAQHPCDALDDPGRGCLLYTSPSPRD